MWSLGAGLAEASHGELAQACAAIAAELATRPAPESGPAALEVAETVGRAVDLAEAALAALVARVDASGAHGEHGFPSAVSWLRERLGMRHGRAAERLTLARQLPRLERVRKLLTGGGLSSGFASAICSATARLADADAVVAEDILLGMVEDDCDVRQVSKAGDVITDLIAERLGRETEPEDSRRGFARSWLVRSKSLDGGSWFKGWLNPEHTAAFDEIVGPLAKPRARGDDRDLPQRTADALMSVLTGGNRGAGVTVIIDLAAYMAATGDTGLFDHTPRTGTGTSTGTRTGTGTGTGTGTRIGTGTGTASNTGEARDAAGSTANSDDRGDRTGRPAAPDRPAQTSTFGRPVRDSRPPAEPPAAQATEPHAQPAAESHAEPVADLDAESDPAGALFSDIRADGVADVGAETNKPRPDDDADPVVTRPPEAKTEQATEVRRRAGPRQSGTDPFVSSAAAMPQTVRKPARLLDGTPISPADARRIALNAGVAPLILGRHGIPIYLGRTARFATAAQRKTLLALHDTCSVRGCQIPAHLCEIHHVGGGWKLGTPTDIDRLTMLCGWHNRWIETHQDQVTEARDDQGRIILTIRPPWTTRPATAGHSQRQTDHDHRRPLPP